MIIVHKLGKLANPVTYKRAWRRAQRYLFPLPLRPILAGIDQARLHEIQNRYREVPRGFAKYTDVDHYLRLNRERVQDLRLHRMGPQRVFDLGCGGGFFLYILRRLGHDVLGLDTDEHALYTELTELFGVQRIVWRIKPFEPLPDTGRRFDWVTAFSIAFDTTRGGDQRWGPREWNFLLEDLRDRHLAPNGKMYFALNPGASGAYYTPELHEFFLARGAKVERERIFFANGLR
jgi:SAM-dependent methyltransferase